MRVTGPVKPVSDIRIQVVAYRTESILVRGV